MGKSQKKRAMRRHNPMRVPDSHLPKGLASASESSSKKDAIPPIMQKMESADAADRKWACVAVSNLIQNDPATRRLLQGKNVIGALITRLSDSEEEVVIEATGALRNLCIDGGYEICAEMYNKNILAPLKTFVPKITSILSQFLESPKAAPENAQNLIYEFADNVITTFWCLSETSNKALDAITQINLVPFLMSFLVYRSKLPLSTVTSAAHCLYVLTDDNTPFIEEVRSNAAYTSCLADIVRQVDADAHLNEDRSLNLRVLASGILRNISPLPPPAAASAMDIDRDFVLPLLQPIVASVSLLNASNKAQTLVSQQLTEPRVDKVSNDNELRTDHKSEIEIELDHLENQLRTIQLALEIMTGVCATLPDPIPDATDDEDEPELEEIADEDAWDQPLKEDSHDMIVEDAHPQGALSSNSFLATLIPLLLSLIQPTPLSFPSEPSIHPPVTSAFSAIHLCALECLNNIFLSLTTSDHTTLSTDTDAGHRIWTSVWQALMSTGLENGPGQERRMEMWRIAAGVLWGAGQIWKGKLAPTKEQLGLIIQLCDATSDPRRKVQCIGTLECLSQNPRDVELNKVISEYLLSLLPVGSTPSSVGAEPMIQTVSALIDIYSDETMPYDINFRQGQYLNRLLNSVDGVRKAVRSIDRRKEGGLELRRRGDDIKENLIAFIKYRKALRL